MDAWLTNFANVSTNVVIVSLFLWYLARRDKEMKSVADEGHKVAAVLAEKLNTLANSIERLRR